MKKMYSTLIASMMPATQKRFAVITLSVLTLLLLDAGVSQGQVNISAGSTISQNFDGMTTSATSALPTSWKADKNATVRLVGTYAAAVSATEQVAGANMSTTATNGIYNFSSGTGTTASDRAVGGVSSSSASKSVNVYVDLLNNGGSSITSFTISYDVEKYRAGSNAAGSSIQMYYSTDGSAWTSAGSNFLTSFAADGAVAGFSTAPGATSSVSSKTLTLTVSASSHIYLAWNYSVTSGTTTSNVQALGIDNVSITAAGTVSAPNVTSAKVPTATYGTAMSNYTVVTTGGTADSFLISSGSLPAGLSLAKTTGIISGTPTALATSTVVGITAYNSAGAGTEGFDTFNVSKKTLTITTPVAASKEYDGNRNTTISGTLNGVIAGDAGNVTLNGTGTFADSLAANTKAVTSTSTLSGSASGFYSLTQPTGLTANITKKNLTISGLSAVSRPYNGGTVASLTGTITLNGVISIDNGNVTTAGTIVANFSDPNVGTWPVTVSGYTLAGTAAGNYTVSQPTVADADITQASQTITFGALPSKEYPGADFNISATSTSGLTVTFSSSDESVATIIGNTVTLVGSGSTTITASQAGDGNYAAATPVDQELSVSDVPLTPQTISFDPANLAGKSYGSAPFNPGATASSGLDVTYESSNTSVATVSGAGATALITIVGPGTTTITAKQAGGSPYGAAPDSALVLTVARRLLIVTSPYVMTKTYDGTTTVPILFAQLLASDFTTAAIGSDVVNVNISVGNFDNANVGTGKPVTAALVLGGADTAKYSITQPTGITGEIIQNTQFISGLPSTDSKVYGTANYSLSATSTSGLAVSYSSSDTNVVTISGNTVHITGGGSVTITASQAGNSNYLAASPVTQVLTITKASQSITFGALAARTSADGSFTLNGTASSGLTVSYSSSVTGVATVSGNTVTIVGAGSTVITASQAGNANYNAATSVPQTLTVTAVTYVPVPMASQSGLTYIDSFTDISNTTTWPNGFNGAGAGTPATRWNSVGIVTGVSLGDGVKTTASTATFAAGTSTGGVQRGGLSGSTNPAGSIVLLSTGTTNSCAIDFFMNFTGVNADSVFFDASTVFNSTGNRNSVLKPFYSTDGITWTAFTGTGVPDTATNNVAKSANIRLALPAAFNNSSSARIRLYEYSTATAVGTPSGSQPKFAIDNLTVTAKGFPIPPSITSSLAANGTYNAPFTYTINATNFPTSYNATGLPAGLSRTGNVISGIPTAAGTTNVTINATNAYGSTDSTLVITIAKANQTITGLAGTATKTYQDADYDLSAAASSGLGVTYSSLDPTVATVSGATVHIVGAGTAHITAHQTGNANYNAAPDTTQVLTVNKKSQTITFAALPDKLSTDANFQLTGTASSGLAVSYTSSLTGVATIFGPNGDSVHIVAPGTTTITASQAGDANWSAAADVPHSQLIIDGSKTNQTVAFAPLSNVTYGDGTFTLHAVASSGLAVSSYTSSNTAVATIVDSTVTIVGPGTTTITAHQAGNASFNAAPDTAQALTVLQKNLTITGATAQDKTYNNSTTATVTGGSLFGKVGSDDVSFSGPANFSSANAGTWSVITSYTLGGTDFAKYTLTQPTLSATINKADQTISGLVTSMTRVFGSADTTLGATASSGLAVSYSSDNNSVATVTGNVVHIAGVGTANITASQAGDGNYNAAAPTLNLAITVNKANQVITFAALAAKVTTDAPFTLTARPSSGLAATYVSSNPAVASVVDSTVTIHGVGSTVITASQAGNANYNAALDSSRTLVVNYPAIFSNTITGTNPSTSNPYTTGQVVDANLTVSGIGRGTGIAAATANDRYTASGWNSASLSSTKYFEFILTPAAGRKIDFTGFSYTGQASGTGPTATSLRSSGDNYATDIPGATIAGTTVSLSDAAFQNIKSTDTFRFFAWGASASGGTFSINDFAFRGFVNCITPAAFTLSGSGNYCTGVGSGISLTLNGSETGINYQLKRDGSDVGSPVAGTGSALDFGAQTVAGTYTVVGSNTASGCNTTTSMTGSGVITVGSPNTSINNVSICSAQLPYTLAGVTTYTGDTSYVIHYTNASGCDSAATFNLTISASLTDYTVSGGGSYCSGGSGVTVHLSGSQTGVSYQLILNGSTNVGSPVAGSGNPIDFTNLTTAGSYTVLGNPGTTCQQFMTGSASVSINALPIAYNVTGGGSYPIDSHGAAVGLDGSETGVSYQLKKDGVDFGSPVTGTGSAISFGNQTAEAVYTVVATNASPCSQTMTGSATVTIDPTKPFVFTITGGGPYCTGGGGSVIGLSGSQTGVVYQLKKATTNVGAPRTGTGDTLIFGTFSVTGTYSVLASAISPMGNATMAGTAVITIISTPAKPASIAAPAGFTANVCRVVGMDTALTYTAANVVVATTYTWTAPTGATIVGGQGTRFAQVKFLPGYAFTPGDSLSVVASNACGTSAPKKMAIKTVLPAKPGSITAATGFATNVCRVVGMDTSITYTSAAVAGAVSYNWSIPANTEITSQVGRTITLKFLPGYVFVPGDSLAVQSVSGCGASAFKRVAVKATVLAKPASITAPAGFTTNVCSIVGVDTSITYVAAAVAGAISYSWTAPTGAEITGTEGRTATVKFLSGYAFTPGDSLAVTAVSGCGASLPKRLAVKTALPAAPAITAVAVSSACGARVYRYTAAVTAGAVAYSWTLPSFGGASLDSGTLSSRVIKVLYSTNAASGTTDSIKVAAVTNCGTSLPKAAKLTVPVKTGCKGIFPSAPGLIKDIKVPAIPTTSVTPTIVVPSTEAKVIAVATPAFTEATTATAYPNPNRGDFTVSIKTSVKANFATIQLIGMNGNVLLEQKATVGRDGTIQSRVSAKGIVAGMYNVRYQVGTETGSVRVMLVK